MFPDNFLNTEGIQVRIDNINIDTVESFKFLGIIIDSKLTGMGRYKTWTPHLDPLWTPLWTP